MKRLIDSSSARPSRPFFGLPAVALLLLTLLAGGALVAPPVSALDQAPADAAASEAPADPSAPATVILVRHAEKAVAPDGEEAYTDPPLTEEGMERAAALARLLAPANISTVYATEYLRTQETVAPLATTLDVAVNLVDAWDTAGLAKALAKHRGEAVVVAGHSNTLGPIIEALGGGAIEPIPESEYDRLYIVTVATEEGGARRAQVLRLSYGEPSPGADEDRPAGAENPEPESSSEEESPEPGS